MLALKDFFDKRARLGNTMRYKSENQLTSFRNSLTVLIMHIRYQVVDFNYHTQVSKSC